MSNSVIELTYIIIETIRLASHPIIIVLLCLLGIAGLKKSPLLSGLYLSLSMQFLCQFGILAIPAVRENVTTWVIMTCSLLFATIFLACMVYWQWTHKNVAKLVRKPPVNLTKSH